MAGLAGCMELDKVLLGALAGEGLNFFQTILWYGGVLHIFTSSSSDLSSGPLFLFFILYLVSYPHTTTHSVYGAAGHVGPVEDKGVGGVAFYAVEDLALAPLRVACLGCDGQ
jgi:hypothetical protein